MSKRRYTSIEEAIFARTSEARSHKINAYWCRWCGGVHNGHPPRVIQAALGY